MSDALTKLSNAGVAVWLDDLARQRLVDPHTAGSLARLHDEYHVVGVTTNPTTFATALDSDTPGSNAYAETLRELAERGVSVDEAVREITTSDVRDACDVLRGVHESTEGLDGRVSLEVDPRLAHDTKGTIAEAAALAEKVARKNLFIKIPATEEGLPAITETLARGISVNVTLIFSLHRYGEVMAAFLEGLEQAVERGHDVEKIASVASFFVSRVDSEVDKRLDALIEAAKRGEGSPQSLAVSSFDPTQALQLRGTAAIANARLVYQRYEKVFTGKRWYPLAQLGARPQRPLWASTGVKDPSYDDTRYVTELVAPNTVNTMPEKTLRAVADHGHIRGNTVTSGYTEAEETLAGLAGVGIDYDDVVSTLEREGVRKFIDSWEELRGSVSRQLKKTRS